MLCNELSVNESDYQDDTQVIEGEEDSDTSNAGKKHLYRKNR